MALSLGYCKRKHEKTSGEENQNTIMYNLLTLNCV